VKSYHARYPPEAARLIRKLHPEIKKDIREGIRRLLNDPLVGHPLHDELSGYRSLRVRTYRVIYQIDDEDTTLDVVFVGPRRNVYEELRELLLGLPGQN
jgi:addiction module RelE/StbE family toxin